MNSDLDHAQAVLLSHIYTPTQIKILAGEKNPTLSEMDKLWERAESLHDDRTLYGDPYLFQGGQHTSSTRDPYVLFFVPISAHRPERRDTKKQRNIPGEKANDNPFV
jgi:hypothetical protein